MLEALSARESPSLVGWVGRGSAYSRLFNQNGVVEHSADDNALRLNL